MIPVTTYAGRSIALFGLGGSGVATAHALVAGGADVTTWDDNPMRVEDAAKAGLKTGDLRQIDWQGVDALVLSPGVPLTHPEPHWTVDLATASSTPIIGDVELYCAERRAVAPDAPLIAITGTNGKSTTTALISHIIASSGRDVAMGGNIGVPVLELEPLSAERIYVVECSSYQIDLAPSLDPTVGILLNLSPDHLDRHGSMENYAAIKQRLVARSQTAIVGIDDQWCKEIASRLTDPITVSVPRDRDLVDLQSAASLRGDHNRQNALIARAACRAVGLSEAEIQNGLDSFGGLAHRMEIVAHLGGVHYVNDSKATNADAAQKSLSSFDGIFWIAGGLPKEGGIDDLASLFGKIAKAYLIGEAAPAFAATLGKHGVDYEISATLDVAVSHAHRDATQAIKNRLLDDAAVLLAPAAASFDQYANFEKRGAAFRDAVQTIVKRQPAEKLSEEKADV